MILCYSHIISSRLPQYIKTELMQLMNYIEGNAPKQLYGVLLFGSIARGNFDYFSDIDLCLVFTDNTNLHSDNIKIFKGLLSATNYQMEVNAVALTKSQLASNSEWLHQEINRDGIWLTDVS